jgi:hypothetical protein
VQRNAKRRTMQALSKWLEYLQRMAWAGLKDETGWRLVSMHDVLDGHKGGPRYLQRFSWTATFLRGIVARFEELYECGFEQRRDPTRSE